MSRQAYSLATTQHLKTTILNYLNASILHMLTHLYIRNFTLIDELDMTFGDGFSVITGETGAGKSIILGAIGLLLGQRADLKAIKAGTDRCTIEAHFDLSQAAMDEHFFNDNELDFDPSDTILRRELSANGKSRSFINDTPVALLLMRQLGERLIDIHSQHQNLLLQTEDFQLSVVDIIASHAPALAEYRTAYARWQSAAKELEVLKQRIQQSTADADFLRYQVDELETARLQVDEQEQLEADRQTMSHAEDIKASLYATTQLLNDDGGILERLKTAAAHTEEASHVYAPAEELSERMESCLIEMKDLSSELDNHAERVDFDPSALEEVNNRLDTIYHLQQKYHLNNNTELLTHLAHLQEQLSLIDNSDEQLRLLEEQVQAHGDICRRQAEALTAARITAARKVEKEMAARLTQLGMPNVRFEVQITPRPLSADGADKVAFLFTANRNAPLMPLSQVASGGETARVMLSLKAMLSHAVHLPTIIFDEIDTGVSGQMAERMARIMREMGREGRQVIAITHLPQIAAMGKTHYRVYKTEDTSGTTTTRMQQLSADERVAEIAQMLSGSSISREAQDNARVLLQAAEE